MRFDELAKQQTEHHGRQRANQDIERKQTRRALRGQSQHRGFYFLPIDQNHCKDGARLNGNVKHLGLVVVKAEQRARQNQMPRRRNRQKLSQTFHHAHDGSFEQQNNIHSKSLSVGAIIDVDGYLAATAIAQGLMVATRDVAPFEAAGLKVINPWTAGH
jgi:predicted nucleic acid-binding protein